LPLWGKPLLYCPLYLPQLILVEHRYLIEYPLKDCLRHSLPPIWASLRIAKPLRRFIKIVMTPIR